MSEIPICKIHQKPMREGKFGWYCATKDAQGQWCKEKFTPPPVQTPVAVPVAQPQAFPRVRLAEAALAFAGRVYQGSGPVGQEDALLLAGQAYKWLIEGTDADIPFGV